MKLSILALISFFLFEDSWAQSFRLGNDRCEVEVSCSESRFETNVCLEIEDMLRRKGYLIQDRVVDARYQPSFNVSSNDEVGNWFSPFYARASVFDSSITRYVFERNKKIGFFSSNDSSMREVARKFVKENVQNCR